MATEVANKPKIRFKLLDGLRLVAALAVMSYHFLGYEHLKWGTTNIIAFPHISRVAAYGALGVQLFFIVSGFVILMSSWGRTIPQFVASRISRLFPAYWFAVIATSILLVFITNGSIKNVSISQFLVNLTMMQPAVGVKHIDGVYWTLWVELLFYLLIGFFMSRNPSRRRLMTFIFLWPLVGAVAASSKFGFLTAILSPQYAPLFAGGMALYLIHAYGHSLINWLLVLFTVIMSAQQTVVGFFAKSMITYTKQQLSPTICVIIVLSMFVIVALFTVSPIRGWGPNWLTYAGALTYPLYLIHEHWGWWIIGWATPVFGKWTALFIAVIFAVLMAVFIERQVERRLHPLIRARIERGLVNSATIQSGQVQERKSSHEKEDNATLATLSQH
jgi:peptidoglycan/LPS O-acetylase OafA/YrhL